MNLSEIGEAKLINDRLSRLYGRHTVIDKPIFRLAFSEELTEKRSGEKAVFADCNGVDIFLRMEDGIHEVQKYPWLDNQWVVEQLMENPHQDVFEGQYIYNCIYAFKENLPCPPWKAIQFFVQNFILVLHNAKGTQPKTQADAEIQEEVKKKAERERIRNLLDITPEGKRHRFDKMVVLAKDVK